MYKLTIIILLSTTTIFGNVIKEVNKKCSFIERKIRKGKIKPILNISCRDNSTTVFYLKSFSKKKENIEVINVYKREGYLSNEHFYFYEKGKLLKYLFIADEPRPYQLHERKAIIYNKFGNIVWKNIDKLPNKLFLRKTLDLFYNIEKLCINNSNKKKDKNLQKKKRIFSDIKSRILHYDWDRNIISIIINKEMPLEIEYNLDYNDKLRFIYLWTNNKKKNGIYDFEYDKDEKRKIYRYKQTETNGNKDVIKYIYFDKNQKPFWETVTYPIIPYQKLVKIFDLLRDMPKKFPLYINNKGLPYDNQSLQVPDK